MSFVCASPTKKMCQHHENGKRAFGLFFHFQSDSIETTNYRNLPAAP
jgi:hypothetical protein